MPRHRVLPVLLAALFLAPARADTVIIVAPSHEPSGRPRLQDPGERYYPGRQHYRHPRRSLGYSQHHLDAQRAAERARQEAEWRRAVDERSRANRWMMHGSTP